MRRKGLPSGQSAGLVAFSVDGSGFHIAPCCSSNLIASRVVDTL